MAAKKTGTTSVSWQAEWTYSDAAGQDGAEIQATYEDDLAGWETRLPEYGSGVPAGVGTGLPTAVRDGFRLKTRGLKGMAGEKVEVEATWSSAWRVDMDPNNETLVPIPRYSMAVSLSEEPILTHERYEALTETEQDALRNIIGGQRWKDEAAGVEWASDVTSAEGLEALAKIRKGVESYREPGLVWRETMRVPWAKLALYTRLDKVRRIDTPPGNPPDDEFRDYLYLGPQIDQDETGEWADLRREWELSGENGWDQDFYAEAI